MKLIKNLLLVTLFCAAHIGLFSFARSFGLLEGNYEFYIFWACLLGTFGVVARYA